MKYLKAEVHLYVRSTEPGIRVAQKAFEEGLEKHLKVDGDLPDKQTKVK